MVCQEAFLPTDPHIIVLSTAIFSALLAGLIASFFIFFIGVKLTSFSGALIITTFTLVSVRIFANLPHPEFITSLESNFTDKNSAYTSGGLMNFLDGSDDSNNPNYFSVHQKEEELHSQQYSPYSDWNHLTSILITVLTILAFSIIFLILSCIRQKFILVLSFCLVGSAMVILGAEHLLDASTILTQLSTQCLTAKLGHVHIIKDFRVLSPHVSVHSVNDSLSGYLGGDNNTTYENINGYLYITTTMKTSNASSTTSQINTSSNLSATPGSLAVHHREPPKYNLSLPQLQTSPLPGPVHQASHQGGVERNGSSIAEDETGGPTHGGLQETSEGGEGESIQDAEPVAEALLQASTDVQNNNNNNNNNNKASKNVINNNEALNNNNKALNNTDDNNLNMIFTSSNNNSITNAPIFPTMVIRCWITWLLYALFPLLVVTSLVFQFGCSARDVHYELQDCTR